MREKALPSRASTKTSPSTSVWQITSLAILKTSSPSYVLALFFAFLLLFAPADPGPDDESLKISDWLGSRTEMMERRTFVRRVGMIG